MDLELLIGAALDHVDDAEGPGVVVVAVTASERVIAARGRAVLEHSVELTPSTPMYVASLAKVITAWSIHRLATDGALALDDPVSRWLDVPWGSSVTVDHLLQHRSGLPELHALRLLAGRDPDDALAPADVRRMLDGMETWFPPGAQVAYNNTNYATLAMVVEVITGQPFADAARDLAFSPLDMPGAIVRDDPGTWIPGMATGYIRRGRRWARASNVSTSVGDGGMWWSGDDLAGLLHHLLVDVGAVSALRRRSPLPDGSTPALGRGLAERDGDGWFGAAAEFFGARAELRVDPASGVAFGVIANSQSAPVGPMLDSMALATGVAPPVQPVPPEPGPGPVPDGVLVGVGGSAWRFTAGDDGRCSAAVGDLEFDLEPDGTAWRVRGRPSVRAGWEQSTLVVRDSGREIARLTRIEGAQVTPELIGAQAGWWSCAAAATVLEVRVGDDGRATVRRGQAAPETLAPVAVTRDAVVMAAPWGLLRFALDGRSATAVLARAEGVQLRRLTAAA